MAIADSQLVPFVPAGTLVTASGTSEAFTASVAPSRQYAGGYRSMVVQLNVTGDPTGGAPTLNVYVQHSVDNLTWQDVASFTQVTNSTSVQYAPISGEASGGTTILAHSDGALAAGTIVQGPWGGYVRVKYAIALGGATGGYTLGVIGILKQ